MNFLCRKNNRLQNLYRARLGFVNFNSARQSKIEAANTREGTVYLRSEEQVKCPWARTDGQLGAGEAALAANWLETDEALPQVGRVRMRIDLTKSRQVEIHKT